jgi:hypothetical protein
MNIFTIFIISLISIHSFAQLSVSFEAGVATFEVESLNKNHTGMALGMIVAHPIANYTNIEGTFTLYAGGTKTRTTYQGRSADYDLSGGTINVGLRWIINVLSLGVGLTHVRYTETYFNPNTTDDFAANESTANTYYYLFGLYLPLSKYYSSKFDGYVDFKTIGEDRILKQTSIYSFGIRLLY